MYLTKSVHFDSFPTEKVKCLFWTLDKVPCGQALLLSSLHPYPQLIIEVVKVHLLTAVALRVDCVLVLTFANKPLFLPTRHFSYSFRVIYVKQI